MEDIEIVRWITWRGRRLPIGKDGKIIKKANNNSISDKLKKIAKDDKDRTEKDSNYFNSLTKEEQDKYLDNNGVYKDAVKRKNIYEKEIEKVLQENPINNEILRKMAKYSIDGRNTEFIQAIYDLDKIVKEEGLEVSKSPYSSSTYAFKKGESVDWDYKPENSYRISNHWNFISRGGKKHAILKDKNASNYGTYLAKYSKGTYEIIQEYRSVYDK